jgi:hypothetical protein
MWIDGGNIQVLSGCPREQEVSPYLGDESYAMAIDDDFWKIRQVFSGLARLPYNSPCCLTFAMEADSLVFGELSFQVLIDQPNKFSFPTIRSSFEQDFYIPPGENYKFYFLSDTLLAVWDFLYSGLQDACDFGNRGQVLSLAFDNNEWLGFFNEKKTVYLKSIKDICFYGGKT